MWTAQWPGPQVGALSRCERISPLSRRAWSTCSELPPTDPRIDGSPDPAQAAAPRERGLSDGRCARRSKPVVRAEGRYQTDSRAVFPVPSRAVRWATGISRLLVSLSTASLLSRPQALSGRRLRHLDQQAGSRRDCVDQVGKRWRYSSRASKMMTWRARLGSFAGIFAGEQRRTARRQVGRPYAQIER
jgi:hypothetical protein